MRGVKPGQPPLLINMTLILKFLQCCSNMDKQPRDNRADQLNPNNPKGGGIGSRPAGYTSSDTSKANIDNRANQKNPNNEKFPRN